MDQIVAPWRIDWIERSPKNEAFDECVFCELPDCEPAEDREHYLLVRGEAAYVLLNNYPYNPGHAMVIPYEHGGEFAELDESALLAKGRLTQRLLRAMDDALGPDGYNVGYNLGGDAAGGSIDDHVHAHVVPRWSGDTNFMPTIAETKVIVEAVTDTYDRLHEALADQDGMRVTDPAEAVRFDPT